MARGREVMGASLVGRELAGVVLKGDLDGADRPAGPGVVVAAWSDIRRVRPGWTASCFGGGEVRRMSRISEAVCRVRMCQ